MTDKIHFLTSKISEPYEWINIVDPFLDVQSILMLRQCSKFFYERQYHPHHGTLSFSTLSGLDGKKLTGEVLPLALKAVSDSSGKLPKISLDFSNCSMIKDPSVARILEYANPSSIYQLSFDFCYQITDKALSVLLDSTLYNLCSFSLKGARSKMLTGEPFISHLSKERWPKLRFFTCSFTNMWLKNVTAVGEFIENLASAAGESTSAAYIDLRGSVASKCLLSNPCFSELRSSFLDALEKGDVDLIARTSKKVQQDWRRVAGQHVLMRLAPEDGGKCLVNIPIQIRGCSEQCAVWTLPLSLATQNECFQVCKLLIKRGADADSWDHMGRTPLFYAAQVGSYDLVELFLKSGASSTPHDMAGESALMKAIQNKDHSICKLLLSSGASVNYFAPDSKNYRSPLHLACEPSNLDNEICSLLLSYKADSNWCSRTNRCTPAMLAYKTDPSILRMFLEAGAGAQQHNKWVLSEIASCAIAQKDYEVMELLVRMHPSILHLEHRFWGLPHIHCSRVNNLRTLSFLLKKGSYIQGSGPDGCTALHMAAEEGNIECLSILLELGARQCIDLPNKKGLTALNVACHENRYDIIDLLLKNGADPNIRDLELGETPLMCSILGRNDDSCLLIIRSSEYFKPDVKNFSGKTALNYALQCGLYEVADELMSLSANVISVSEEQTEELKKRTKEISPEERRVLKRFLKLQTAQKKEQKQAKNNILKNVLHSRSGNENSTATGSSSSSDLSVDNDDTSQSYSDPVVAGRKNSLVPSFSSSWFKKPKAILGRIQSNISA
eukprot:GHVP01042825.1.p1 GENE.GHVP01042825.1~~GHVP01042825.1.p1  ORF type:complete len:784 (+),score=108.45 GHVP01042825.1:5092-7443(+)